MKSEHSPGTWTIMPITRKRVITEKNYVQVCNHHGALGVYLYAVAPGMVEEANAKLICAAPELLAALKLISGFKGKTLIGGDRYDEGANRAFEECAAIALEAIAKVEAK